MQAVAFLRSLHKPIGMADDGAKNMGYRTRMKSENEEIIEHKISSNAAHQSENFAWNTRWM